MTADRDSMSDPASGGRIEEPDTEGHRLAANDDETIVLDEEPDTEGHRLASNDDETVVTEGG